MHFSAQYSSDLLSLLLRDTLRSGGMPAQENIDIPWQLQPVISARGPLPNLTGQLNTDTQRESFIMSAGATQLASTATVTTVIATVGIGLWELYLTLNHLSDFTAVAFGSSVIVQLQDPAGNAKAIMSCRPGANVPQLQSILFTVHFPSDGWRVQFVHPTTGVGQNMCSSLSVLGNRLT